MEFELCINRNILECKAWRYFHVEFCVIVLIETYWNVKKYIINKNK